MYIRPVNDHWVFVAFCFSVFYFLRDFTNAIRRNSHTLYKFFYFHSFPRIRFFDFHKYETCIIFHLPEKCCMNLMRSNLFDSFIHILTSNFLLLSSPPYPDAEDATRDRISKKSAMQFSYFDWSALPPSALRRTSQKPQVDPQIITVRFR